MAAPVVAVVIAWLAGVGATISAPTVATTLAGAAKVEAGATIAYADIAAGCPLVQPFADTAAKRWSTHPGVVRLARMTDALCVAVQRPDTPQNQALATAAVIAAISEPKATAPASALVAAASEAIVIPRRMCGKTAC